MPHYSKDRLHLGSQVCTLCRQLVKGEDIIFTHSQAVQYVVQGCPSNSCHDPFSLTTWCHKSCCDILADSYETAQIPTWRDIEKLDYATKALYSPPKEYKRAVASVEEGLFSDHTKRIMDGCFRQELLKKMPAEVLGMILEYIGPCPPFLRILGERRRLMERLRNTRKNQCEQLSLTEVIYLTRINYQDISYISRVSNAWPSKKMPPDESLKVPSNTQQIILSKDHMGIRNIQFLSKNSDSLEDGAPWYGIIEVSESISNITVNTRHSGLFLRKFQLHSNCKRIKETIWSSPQLPKFQRIYCGGFPRRGRLHHVALETDVKGLAICCSNARTIGLHAYSGTLTDYEKFVTRMKQQGRRDICWMFFPINEGESIRQVWIRYREQDEEFHEPIIMLQTTRYRTITFGPCIHFDIQDKYRFRPCIKKGDGVVSGICHDGLDPESEYISVIGVTYDPHRPTESTRFEINSDPPPQTILNVPSNDISGFTWYMTEASLQGLFEVQVCQDKNQSHCPCIGLLLYYQNESVEAIGQVRWDLEMSSRIPAPIQIQKSSQGGKNYIGNVRQALRSGHNMVEDGWQEIPDRGTIGWWFSHRGDDLVVHDE